MQPVAIKTTWIERLRQKPEGVRKFYVFSVSITVTLIVFALWAVSFSNELNDQSQAGVILSGSPFSTIGNTFGDIIDGAKADFDGLLKNIK